MGNEEALEALKKLYGKMGEHNWLYVGSTPSPAGSIDPEVIKTAIYALEQEIRLNELMRV